MFERIFESYPEGCKNMAGFILIVVGGMLSVTQVSQLIATQQQAAIAAQRAAAGQSYTYQHVGSAFLAGLGIALLLLGFIWLWRDEVKK